MAKQKPMAAADFMAQLEKDPEYQRKTREKEKQWKKQRAILDADQKELVSELNAAGIQVTSVWDLVNAPNFYQAAIPILVEHLEKEHHPRTAEGIVRALITPESKGNAGILIRMFESRMFKSEADPEFQMKWLLGAAIAESAVESDADKIIELANDENHGRGREFLPLGLFHASKEKALPVLNSWTDDPILGENARKAIKLLGRPKRDWP